MATLKQARLYQKRMRDKEYRLRKRGARESAIKATSPRVSAHELKTYTPSQLDSYIAQAKVFTKKARYDIAGNGDLIPSTYGKRVKELLRMRNKWIAKEEKRLQSIAPESWWGEYVQLQRGVLKANRSRLGLLEQVDLKKLEKPSSLEAARLRMQRLEKRKRRRFGFYRSVQRKNMIYQLETLGLYDLSNIVRKMSSKSFDILSSVSPVWENLSLRYERPEEKVGFSRLDVEKQESEYAKGIGSFVYYAAALDMKKPGGKHEVLSKGWKASVENYFAERHEENYAAGEAWAAIHAEKRAAVAEKQLRSGKLKGNQGKRKR